MEWKRLVRSKILKRHLASLATSLQALPMISLTSTTTEDLILKNVHKPESRQANAPLEAGEKAPDVIAAMRENQPRAPKPSPIHFDLLVMTFLTTPKKIYMTTMSFELSSLTLREMIGIQNYLRFTEQTLRYPHN